MNYLTIRKFVNKIKKKKSSALILGDLMLDHYVHGKVMRISPEAPVPVLNFESEKYSLGGAGNVAHNSVNLGSDVFAAGIIGNDLNGSIIKKLLIKHNISTKFISTVSKINTTIKTRYLSAGSQLLRLDYDSEWPIESNYYSFEQKIKKEIDKFDYIIISDYDKGVCSDLLVKNIIKKALECNIQVYVDPKGKNWNKYSNASCITPNTKEVEDHLKTSLNSDLEFEKAAEFLKNKYNLSSCLITRGSSGMTFNINNNSYHQKVEKKEVFDVSGAGDTVIASVSAALSAGLSVEESLMFASATSSEVVTHIGTIPFKRSMIIEND